MSRQIFLFCIIVSLILSTLSQAKKDKKDVKEFEISENEFFGELDLTKLRKQTKDQKKIKQKIDNKSPETKKGDTKSTPKIEDLDKKLEPKEKVKYELNEDEILKKLQDKIKKYKPLIVENTNKTHTEKKPAEEMKVVTEHTTEEELLEQDNDFIEKQEEYDDIEGLNDHFEEEIPSENSNLDVKDEL